MADGMTADEQSAIEQFPGIAEGFCRLIDDCDKLNRRQLVQQLAVHLARLCEAAACLPSVVPPTEGVDHAPEAVAAHAEDCVKLSSKLRQIFGSIDVYWEVFDPTQKDDPVSCSLAIDIAEIYLDLKNAL